jgi:ubiquinone/menaquinone biosynthesis C-methylase UbiE
MQGVALSCCQPFKPNQNIVQQKQNTANRYFQSCANVFWQEVFSMELDYLLQHLDNRSPVLSIGCGTAPIEERLANNGYTVYGVDIHGEMLKYAPENIKVIAASAENLPFPKSTFGAVISVASLQFIQNVQRAVKGALSVLKQQGVFIAMLLNPASSFFKEKFKQPNSYISTIKHVNLEYIEDVISEDLFVETEYYIGENEGKLFKSSDSAHALLYIAKGYKKPQLH